MELLRVEEDGDAALLGLDAGRADQLDRAAIERLITALTRVVGVEAVPAGPDRARAVGVPGLEFTESRPLGGAWLLDKLWHRLGMEVLTVHGNAPEAAAVLGLVRLD